MKPKKLTLQLPTPKLTEYEPKSPRSKRLLYSGPIRAWPRSQPHQSAPTRAWQDYNRERSRAWVGPRRAIVVQQRSCCDCAAGWFDRDDLQHGLDQRQQK